MRAAAFLAICLVGCSRSVPFSTKGAAPSTPEEVIVAKWILDHADDPGSVEFAKWGPNAKPGEYKTIDPSFDGTVWDEGFRMTSNPDHIVRVVYRQKNKHGGLERLDILFYFDKNVLSRRDANDKEDRWLTFWPEWVKTTKATKAR